MDVITLSAKTCMAHLLLKETFDQFSFIEGEITTFNKFTLDGFLQKDFFDDAPTRSHSYWKEVRELCFAIIRGRRTPLSFKIVLSLAPETLPLSWRSTRLAPAGPRTSRLVPELPL